jgi:hypothetical protein
LNPVFGGELFLAIPPPVHRLDRARNVRVDQRSPDSVEFLHRACSPPVSGYLGGVGDCERSCVAGSAWGLLVVRPDLSPLHLVVAIEVIVISLETPGDCPLAD